MNIYNIALRIAEVNIYIHKVMFYIILLTTYRRENTAVKERYMFKPELQFIPGLYAICRLESKSGIPSWAAQGDFFSITRTKDELSIVCEEKNVPEGVLFAGGYAALKVQGPLDFSLTGILSSISAVLANANISIFALSTYDTDYILLRESDRTAASLALKNAGYIVHA